MRIIRNILFLMICVIFLPPPHANAESGSEAETLQQIGSKYYSEGNYNLAIDAFNKAVSIAPENSVYHHWLGKSYGRMAEQSGILHAYQLSIKTREELEKAVELDENNLEALQDLMKFYEQAPSLVGGGHEKAENIRRRLDFLIGKNKT